MTTPSSSRFTGSIPAIYDAHLGPLLFDFSAVDIARRVGDAAPPAGRVLEVACGTGIVTEQLRRVLPFGVEIVATDLNDAMLDYARDKRGSLSAVRYQQADAQALPFDDASFDVVVCQYGIMFFPDKDRGLAEMTRVLKPGGRLILNVWDSLEHNRIVEIARDTLGLLFESDPPRFLDLPFGDHALDQYKRRFAATGLRDLQISVVTEEVVCPDAESPARGLVEGNPGVAEIRERGGTDTESVVQAVVAALHREYGDGPLRVSLQEIVFEATKPRTELA